MSRKVIGICLIVLLVVAGSATFSRPVDPETVMHIEADTSIFDYKTGLNVFDGHVKVTRGKDHLLADRLTTKRNKKHQITEAIAYGIQEQATYWTQLKSGERPVFAKANVMRYYPQKGSMTLQQDVTITQGKNSFQGEVIIYNMSSQSVLVPASNNARSVLVYHPEEK